MGLTEIVVPPALAAKLAGFPAVDLALFSAWERTVHCMYDQVRFLIEELDCSDHSLEQAFLGLEVVSVALEATEYLGSYAHRVLCSQGGPAHLATNPEIAKVFTRIRTGVGPQTVAALLRIPPVLDQSRIADDDRRVAELYGRVLANGVEVLQACGAFWATTIDEVRWFRHGPAYLTVEDTERLTPEPSPARDKIRHELASMEDVIFAFVTLNRREFVYSPLTRSRVLHAAGVARTAVRFLFAAFGNYVLPESSPNRELSLPRIPGSLARNLTDEEKALLSERGGLVLVV